ncbi:Zinc finger protein 93 [Plakobranchus ocellatus]|uniref:Zinc finger protein 93 n=1 Tax=Plakobranchus ocellatus TaxID=259542 RepID=A0AAV4CG02_9GAST|nr:Zinc finger protein 93 [Plakobranchus ocellatus]
MMEQESKPDVLDSPGEVGTASSLSETNQDSFCVLAEQKPDIKLLFSKDKPSVCHNVASPRNSDVCAFVSKPSANSNPNPQNADWSEQQSMEQVTSEPDSEAYIDVAIDEKPCIEALRAAVEAYSRNEEKKDGELGKSPTRSTEMSSLACFNPSSSFQNVPSESETVLRNKPKKEWKKISTPSLTNSSDGSEAEWTADSKGPATAAGTLWDSTTGQGPYTFHVFHGYASTLSNQGRINTGKKLHECDVCGKQFVQNGNLSVHKRIHTGEKPYTCNICGKMFTFSSCLSKHTLIHTGQKPHKCDICGKGFTVSCELSRHKRIHTGEKPYECEVCGNRFNDRSTLTKHRRIHTGEKPYTCDVCDKRFRFCESLTKHKRLHTGEKPYKCDICSKEFNYSSNLSQHRRIHTNEEPYKCDVCSKVGNTTTLRPAGTLQMPPPAPGQNEGLKDVDHFVGTGYIHKILTTKDKMRPLVIKSIVETKVKVIK